ncbi:hypothetical protein [Paludisphaera mucosa]|uniref:Uncharacterized protein n=1 Tax=Paludisphaera mucosa TaxID=3030827 RepID=A0ABT6F650_9BACT|nr:hypothetical protein [Paludisphaera mucosa]MDG3003050.1 hypothetical protein [Paludisphaera mucosa]
MVSMHCPSCGAEGRVPKDKVDTRLLCKKCLKSFHLTSAGKIVAGPPPDLAKGAMHHPDPVHALDHVEEEVDHWVARLKSIVPKVALAAVLVLLIWVARPLVRGPRPLSRDDQAVKIAHALVRNDVPTLRKLSVSGTGDAAAELSEAILPELREHGDLQSATPTVELTVKPEAPGPGLSEVVASIRPDQPVGRLGFAVPDVSTNMKIGGAVEVTMILSGDDQSGWRLDGGRTLKAFRDSRVADLAKVAKPGTGPR